MKVPASAQLRVVSIATAGAMVLAGFTTPTAGLAADAADQGAPKGGSRVGISKRVIKLGMHMPTTGAVPVDDTSAQQAKDIYFRWLRAKGRKINGRRVRVVLRNDNSNPSEAINACKQLVTEDKVFALIGFTGADQMQACARYAASVDVPYISPGSTEVHMDQGQTFATTMTWPDQGKLMADFMVTKLKARRRASGIVRHNTPSSNGLHRRFVRSMRKRDAEVAYDRTVPINANTADANVVAQELAAQGIKNVLVHTTPVFFLQLLRAASQQDYRPQWTGIDTAMQSGEIGTSGCGFNGNLAGAKFFSPYPALADRDRFDKKFDRALNRFHPGTSADEVHWGNWAQQKAIAQLLRRPGRNLTRKRFVYFAERTRKIKTGVGPRLDYRPKDHFGARQVHLNRADCSGRGEWHTKKAFVSDFKRQKKRG